MSIDMTNFDRRDFIKISAGAAAIALLPGATLAKEGADPFHSLLADFAQSLLRQSPETATQLGLDKGKLIALKSQLSDASPEGEAKLLETVKDFHQKLGRLDRTNLKPEDQIRYDSVSFSLDRALEGTAFKYADPVGAGLYGGAHPYVVSQQDGALTQLPEFLDSQHQIHNAADAEAYLARVRGFAKLLDQESDKVRRDADLGAAPPDFIAAKALGQLKAYRAMAADQQRLVGSLVERAAKQGIKGDWGKRCSILVEKEVYPALDRQIAAVTAAAAKSKPGAGLQRLADGDAYYAWALRLGTTTNASPDEVHKIGLEQNEEIKARMDTILKAQGLTNGSVGERVQALNSDPRFLYPDDDAGRAELIAYLNDCIARIRPMLPNISHLGLKAEVQVKRVPPDIQDGAALGYMNFASLDGSRPAIYYVNLKSTKLWPKYQLPTLTAHEGVPGHTWQGAYLAEHHDEIPLISSLIGFNAFVEGWALYAEQLMAEQGLYKDDPFGEIGYLQAQQFRACRLVTDTGLHSQRWSRDQAVQFLTEQTGKGKDAMTSETDRYCASPGQACGYKMGHNEILRLRAKAQAALGGKFDLASFDDVLVKTGGVPLTVLANVVDGYIAGAGRG